MSIATHSPLVTLVHPSPHGSPLRTVAGVQRRTCAILRAPCITPAPALRTSTNQTSVQGLLHHLHLHRPLRHPHSLRKPSRSSSNCSRSQMSTLPPVSPMSAAPMFSSVISLRMPLLRMPPKPCLLFHVAS